jgi:hypothetical protein
VHWRDCRSADNVRFGQSVTPSETDVVRTPAIFPSILWLRGVSGGAAGGAGLLLQVRGEGGEEGARRAEPEWLAGKLQGEGGFVHAAPGEEGDGGLAAEGAEAIHWGGLDGGAGEAEVEGEVAAAQLQVGEKDAALHGDQVRGAANAPLPGALSLAAEEGSEGVDLLGKEGRFGVRWLDTAFLAASPQDLRGR